MHSQGRTVGVNLLRFPLAGVSINPSNLSFPQINPLKSSPVSLLPPSSLSPLQRLRWQISRELSRYWSTCPRVSDSWSSCPSSYIYNFTGISREPKAHWIHIPLINEGISNRQLTQAWCHSWPDFFSDSIWPTQCLCS